MIGWAGRLTGDQAAARPRPRAARRRPGSVLVLAGDGELRGERRGARADARRRRSRAAARLRRRHRRRGTPRSTRSCSRRRTRARRSSRSRRSPPACPSSRPTRAARAPSSTTARRASLAPVGDVARARGARCDELRDDPRPARSSSARAARERMRERFSTERMVDDVERLYAADPRAVKVLHATKVQGRRRRRAASAHAAAGAARARRRRALPLARRGRRRRSGSTERSTSATSRGRAFAAASTSSPRLAATCHARRARASGPTCCTRTWSTPTSTARSRRTCCGIAVRLDAPQRRPLPARAVSLRRPRVHARRAARSIAISDAVRAFHVRAGPARGEARDDPLRARRAARGAVGADAGGRGHPGRARRSCSRSAA